MSMIQVGKGHCFVCHKETEPNQFHPECIENRIITDCVETCGPDYRKWNEMRTNYNKEKEKYA